MNNANDSQRGVAVATPHSSEVKPPSPQTRSHYVFENVAKRALTMSERSERISNYLRSF